LEQAQIQDLVSTVKHFAWLQIW